MLACHAHLVVVLGTDERREGGEEDKQEWEEGAHKAGDRGLYPQGQRRSVHTFQALLGIR